MRSLLDRNGVQWFDLSSRHRELRLVASGLLASHLEASLTCRTSDSSLTDGGGDSDLLATRTGNGRGHGFGLPWVDLETSARMCSDESFDEIAAPECGNRRAKGTR